MDKQPQARTRRTGVQAAQSNVEKILQNMDSLAVHLTKARADRNMIDFVFKARDAMEGFMPQVVALAEKADSQT